MEHNPTDLTGRVAVITGATKNIGLATATTLVNAGADVAIFSRSPDRVEAVAKDLNALGRGKVIGVAGDVTDAGDLLRLAEGVLHTFGGVDILVNNALVDMGHSPTLDTLDENWLRGVRGYLTGPMGLIKSLRPSMDERGHGSIVNLVSTAAFTPVVSLGAYGIMKAAMWASTRYLARELSPTIRVNAVSPGTTSDDGTVQDKENWQRLIPTVPLQRMGTPHETAQTVLYLASDASSYTTGQVILVDGGRVALNGPGVV